jgi:N-terminal half of MaoC dehydratase
VNHEPDDAVGANLGEAGPEFKWVVEPGKLMEFARACFNDSPGDGTESAFAPPTFPQVASNFWEPPGSRRGLTEPFDNARVLHGEQKYDYRRPLRAGDVLTGQTRLVDYYRRQGRRGGAMRFAIYETTFVDDGGQLVASARTTVIETARPATSDG